MNFFIQVPSPLTMSCAGRCMTAGTGEGFARKGRIRRVKLRAAAIALPVCLGVLHVNSDLKETLYQISPPAPHRAKPPGLVLEPQPWASGDAQDRARSIAASRHAGRTRTSILS